MTKSTVQFAVSSGTVFNSKVQLYLDQNNFSRLLKLSLCLFLSVTLTKPNLTFSNSIQKDLLLYESLTPLENMKLDRISFDVLSVIESLTLRKRRCQLPKSVAGCRVYSDEEAAVMKTLR